MILQKVVGRFLQFLGIGRLGYMARVERPRLGRPRADHYYKLRLISLRGYFVLRLLCPKQFCLEAILSEAILSKIQMITIIKWIY